MKAFIKSSKGSIMMSCFLIGMLLMLVALSSLTLSMNDHQKTLSNSDAVKANYLAEMGIEIAVNNIEESVDAIIDTYLEKLKKNKLEYLKSIYDGESTDIQYQPPSFNIFIKQSFIHQLNTFNTSRTNPIADYGHNHSYSVKVEYNNTGEVVVIKSLGIYNNARKQIIVEGKNPYPIDDGYDMYGLPKIRIQPFEISAYYHTIITD